MKKIVDFKNGTEGIELLGEIAEYAEIFCTNKEVKEILSDFRENNQDMIKYIKLARIACKDYISETANLIAYFNGVKINELEIDAFEIVKLIISVFKEIGAEITPIFFSLIPKTDETSSGSASENTTV